jgi:excisionase family DNA binding protein
MSKSRKAEDYAVLVRETVTKDGKRYIWAYSIDFDLNTHDTVPPFITHHEKLVQTAKLIMGIQAKIADHLMMLERHGKSHPSPLMREQIRKLQKTDEISLKEACKLLGEAPHNVRRMADEGVLKTTRTRKGHRRFFRCDIETFLFQKVGAEISII